MIHEYWEAYEATLPPEGRGYTRTNPLCRPASMSDEIEIEVAAHEGHGDLFFSAKSGAVCFFRESPLKAICALVEHLAS